MAIRCRIGSPASGRELWNAALSEAGQIDVVVKNAGISPAVTIDSTDEEWDREWAAVICSLNSHASPFEQAPSNAFPMVDMSR